MLLIIVLCYLGGRLHQWHRATDEREAAYRDGYDTATKSLFSLATRTARSMVRPRGAATVVIPAMDPPAEPTVQRTARPARHRAESRRQGVDQTRVFGPADSDDRLSA